MRKHVNLMLQNGIINKSNSPWSALVVMARKKDGSWRFCINYQSLNSVTKKDTYLLPRIDDTIHALGFGKRRVFSTMDVTLGYWHIPIEDCNKEKTAFTTNSGTYQFNVTPFGLTGAAGSFCRAMKNCLREFLYMFVVSGHLYRPLPSSQPCGLKVKIKDSFGTRPPRRF